MKVFAVFLLFCCSVLAEVHVMTLREAVALAMEQNPDVVLARLDGQKARAQITIAHDPFTPKIFAGSGAAWTYGFPSSIDGNAPSIVQTKTVMSIFDRPQSYVVAQATEASRGSQNDIAIKQDDAAYRVASLYLDAEQASSSLAAVQREVENLSRVKDLVETRVNEGRELPIESKKANVNLMRARLTSEGLTSDLQNAETALAIALGFSANDSVRPSEDRTAVGEPPTEEASIEKALADSPELRKLESNLQVKTLEIKGFQAERLPKINLVAQYSLLAKYNNFQQYFQRFSRNNVELGASFEIPVLAGHAGRAYAAQSEADAAKIRTEVSRTRNRITSDLRKAYQDLRHADTSREVARADLDLAREQLSIDLAQYDEGRAPLAKVEASRATENEKWLAYYDTQHTAELARLNVLRQTGTLVASLK